MFTTRTLQQQKSCFFVLSENCDFLCRYPLFWQKQLCSSLILKFWYSLKVDHVQNLPNCFITSFFIEITLIKWVIKSCMKTACLGLLCRLVIHANCVCECYFYYRQFVVYLVTHVNRARFEEVSSQIDEKISRAMSFWTYKTMVQHACFIEWKRYKWKHKHSTRPFSF